MIPPKNITIVIPAYNEEESIAAVIDDLRGLDPDYRLLVIDDGSSDRTAELARSRGATVIRHPYNKGYGAALKTGIRIAETDFVQIFDADGQHDPKDIDRLAAHAETYDMVVGARDPKTHSTAMRRPGKMILGRAANFLAGRKIPDLNSGLRLFRRERVAEFLHILPNGFSFTTTITLAFLRAAYDVEYVPIRARGRAGGKSRVSFFRDAVKVMLLIIRVVVLFNPLKVFVPLSLLLGTLGTAFSIFGVIVYRRVPNTGILVILTGVIVFSFGVLADQISAIRRERFSK